MADRDCPICGEQMEDLGYADELTSRDEVRLVRSYECRPCGEEFVARPQPPDGWRDDIRAAVRGSRGELGCRPWWPGVAS